MPELLFSKLPAVQEQRLLRLMMDARKLRDQLTMAEIRTAYEGLEKVRDTISEMLDKVDGK